MRPTSERDHAERMGIPERQLDNALQARHGALLFILGLLRFCARKPAMYLDDR